MMLKKKSNNWARLKLALLVPVGFAALSAFARPETSPPPAATMTDNIHLSINKSTVNQETMQQDHAVFLTYKESGSEDLNSIVCKTLDRIRTRVAEGQFKNALEVTVNPAFDDIPASYLETVKDVLEERDIKCKIDMTVPNTIMDDVAKPYRKYDDVVYLIQNKKIVAALSISKFSANQNDPRLDKISKSASLILQPENPKVSRQEMEKLKNLLDKKGLTSEINMNIFKIGDAAAPPPPPPAGQVIFSYRDGQPDQQFVLYDRHAKPGANLGQRIDKIYKDNITKVSIKINKSTPKDLLETVKQELKKKINYPVIRRLKSETRIIYLSSSPFTKPAPGGKRRGILLSLLLQKKDSDDTQCKDTLFHLLFHRLFFYRTKRDCHRRRAPSTGCFLWGKIAISSGIGNLSTGNQIGGEGERQHRLFPCLPGNGKNLSVSIFKTKGTTK